MRWWRGCRPKPGSDWSSPKAVRDRGYRQDPLSRLEVDALPCCGSGCLYYGGIGAVQLDGSAKLEHGKGSRGVVTWRFGFGVDVGELSVADYVGKHLSGLLY